MATPIKTFFCAKEQKDTEHVLTTSPINAEIIATCECGEFVKFSANINREEFDRQIEAYSVANQGQVSTEAIEENLQALVD